MSGSFEMDPFLTGDAGRITRELTQLQKENRDLRERVSELRLQLQESEAAQLPPEATRDSAASKRSPLPEHDSGVQNGASAAAEREVTKQLRATVKQLKEELVDVKKRLAEANAANAAPKAAPKGGSAKGSADPTLLKSRFEGFALEVAEREEAFKLVYSRLHAELTEQKNLVAELQRRQGEAPAVAGPAPSDGARHVTRPTAPAAPPVPAFDVGALSDMIQQVREQLSDIENHICGGPQSAAAMQQRNRFTTATAAKRPRSEVGGYLGVKHDIVTASKPTGIVAAPAVSHSHAAVTTLHGAGATVLVQAPLPLESSSSGLSEAKPERRLTTVSDTASSTGTLTKRRMGRPRKNMESKSVAEESTAAGSPIKKLRRTNASLFDSLASAREKQTDVAAAESLHFGEDPVADYLSLLEQSTAAQREVLRRELMSHCGNDVTRLAMHVVSHFLSKKVQSANVLSLWKCVQHLVELHGSLFSSFAAAVIETVAGFIGPESGGVDHSTQLRSLTMALRLWHYVEQNRRSRGVMDAASGSSGLASMCDITVVGSVRDGVTECDRLRRLRRTAVAAGGTPRMLDVPLLLLYEASVSALRHRNAPSHSDATASRAPAIVSSEDPPLHLQVGTDTTSSAGTLLDSYLAQWRVVATTLFGNLSEVNDVLRYYANASLSEEYEVPEVGTMTHSFVWYAIQVTMSLAFLPPTPAGSVCDEAAVAAARNSWLEVCDSVGWSRNLLPFDAMARASAAVLSQSSSAGTIAQVEATMVVRLLILSRGFSYIQTVSDLLKSASPLGDPRSIDASFAVLMSLAVVDFSVSDARDDNWRLAMAFFEDYLRPADEISPRVTGGHLLVVRAILHHRLSGRPSTISGEETLSLVQQHVDSADNWLRSQQAALSRKRTDGGGSGSCPLLTTHLGRQLLALEPPRVSA